MQYNPRINQLVRLKTALEKENLRLENYATDKDLKEILGNTKLIRASIVELENELNQDEEQEVEVENDGKTKNSFLEKLQTNVKRWNEVTQKKSA